MRRISEQMSLFLGTAAMVVVTSTAACAQEGERQNYALPAQPLARSILAVTASTHRSIVVPTALVADYQAPVLNGRYTIEEALDLLLAGSGLRARRSGTSFIIERSPEVALGVDTPPSGSDIVVTGTKISGAPTASTVIALRREAMRSAGRSTVDDVIRTIPQNFSGGQNPGVGFNVPEASGSNVGGSSSVNLRGIGSDATLTLLDGHRLPYSAALQSIDISAIPFGAIDRIEIVPDGASAIYGSDAVAGVVNVILRRDFTGLETSAKIGGSTDGGYLVQQYGATAGTRWASGNVVLAYEYDSNGAVVGSDRDYTARTPGLMLFPPQHQHNVALIARQQLASNVSVSIDGLLGRRVTDTYYATNPAGDISVSGYFFSARVKSFSVAPSLDLALASNWKLSLDGTYGDNRTSYSGGSRVGTVFTAPGAGYYTNRGSSTELSATGPVVTLPGGSAKAALGVGWRRNDFFRFTGAASGNIKHAQDSYYAYGEINLPVVSALTASAALRYERYPGIGDVVTPKLGAILAVTPDLEVKASWGKSFRAPTLYQQYQPQFAYLTTAGLLGGTGFPANATALLSLGGNSDLKPERSTTWSAGLDLHPRSMPGFSLSLSYFSIDYTDRIVTPIPFFTQSLSNPIYAAFVTRTPGAGAQTAFLAESATFTNLAGAPYDAANVVAIVRNASVNAGRQRIRGVDASLRYSSTVGPGTGHVGLDLGYLDSNQQLSASQPVMQLAGVIFNPPHLKGRGEIGYSVGGLSLTGNITFIGPVRDRRAALPVRVDGMTPVDLTFRYKIGGDGPFGGLDLILSAQNLFNEDPGRIAATLLSDVPYDSTNYTPLGRVVSISVTKKW